MYNGPHTATFFICRPPAQYYTSVGWETDIRMACLYTSEVSAGAALDDVRRTVPQAWISCVIQNKLFDYFDGKSFVYDLAKAKLFSPDAVHAELEKLSGQKK